MGREGSVGQQEGVVRAVVVVDVRVCSKVEVSMHEWEAQNRTTSRTLGSSRTQVVVVADDTAHRTVARRLPVSAG